MDTNLLKAVKWKKKNKLQRVPRVDKDLDTEFIIFIHQKQPVRKEKSAGNCINIVFWRNRIPFAFEIKGRQHRNLSAYMGTLKSYKNILTRYHKYHYTFRSSVHDPKILTTVIFAGKNAEHSQHFTFMNSFLRKIKNTNIKSNFKHFFVLLEKAFSYIILISSASTLGAFIIH